jgi:hypothetical protein
MFLIVVLDPATEDCLSEEPKCKASRSEIFGADGSLTVFNECPACRSLGVRCLIASHPAAAAVVAAAGIGPSSPTLFYMHA